MNFLDTLERKFLDLLRPSWYEQTLGEEPLVDRSAHEHFYTDAYYQKGDLIYSYLSTTYYVEVGDNIQAHTQRQALDIGRGTGTVPTVYKVYGQVVEHDDALPSVQVLDIEEVPITITHPNEHQEQIVFDETPEQEEPVQSLFPTKEQKEKWYSSYPDQKDTSASDKKITRDVEPEPEEESQEQESKDTLDQEAGQDSGPDLSL